jgi:perosamine synthetase
VTTGEGGMVTTNDDDVDARVRLFRGQGMDPHRRYWFPIVGFNYRMTNIQAALGVAQLEMIDTQLTRRREIARWYDDDLRRLNVPVTLPPCEPWAEPVNWLYTVRLEQGGEAQRDAVMEALAVDGVETRPVFYPIHILPPYHGSGGDFPVAETESARGVSLPTHAALTRDDVAYVVERLARHLGTR